MSVAGTTAITEFWAKAKAYFAAKTHAHAASDITSGTLPQARGGTGASTFDGAMTDFAFDHATDYGALYMDDDELWYMDALPVDYGGTGSKNAAGARASLGAQETLVSGTNIKTINNESLLGSGNIVISGGGTVDTALSDTSTNAVENRAIVAALDDKADAEHEHDASDIVSGTLTRPLTSETGTVEARYMGVLANSSTYEGVQFGRFSADSNYLYYTAFNTNGGNVRQWRVSAGASVAVGSSPALQYRDYDGSAWGAWLDVIPVYAHESFSANMVLASPNGAQGVPSMRGLVAADIPNIAASKITSGTMSQLRVQPIYYQARGSGSKSLTAGIITQVTLATTGALSSGSGLAIASGGIKVTTAGRYRITASAYVQNTATASNGRGVYVMRATSSGAYSAATEVMSAMDIAGASAGAVVCGPKILALSANDVLYLAARSTGAAGTCDQSNFGTYLLVERLS